LVESPDSAAGRGGSLTHRSGARRATTRYPRLLPGHVASCLQVWPICQHPTTCAGSVLPSDRRFAFRDRDPRPLRARAPAPSGPSRFLSRSGGSSPSNPDTLNLVYDVVCRGWGIDRWPFQHGSDERDSHDPTLFRQRFDRRIRDTAPILRIEGAAITVSTQTIASAVHQRCGENAGSGS
jgi:hypothetical protein